MGEEKGVVAFFFFSRSGWCNEELGELDTCVRETRTHIHRNPPKKKLRSPPIYFIYFFLFFFRIFPTYVFRVFGATAEGKQNVGHKQTNVSVRSCKEGRDRMER